MGDRIKAAVIGTGRIGVLHAANIATRCSDIELAAVSDVVLASAHACARANNVFDVYADYRAVLDRSDIDAVVICSSTDTHARIIMDAAESGKHIFCEKPIGFDLPRIDIVLQAVKTAGVKLQIGFNRRFDPSFRRAKTAIENGAVGKLHLLRITSRDPAPPPISYIEVSGGLFFDMTIHDFDMARFLAGCDADEVYAKGAVLVDEGIGQAGDIDTALILLTFENGAICSIDNSRRAVYGYDQRIEVFGSAGMVEAGNEHPNTVVLSGAETIRQDLPLNFFMDRYADAYLSEIHAFFTSVKDDTDPPVCGEDGRAPVVMAIAAQKSLKENRPVKLADVG